ncbi:MAG: hypothetical protein E6R03_16190 [Hyphomicrobiaceae bacterium]|nr:MAG: hypothetical protein E6R03_16190 [Hyphomicrobiaceae bacterium]
MPTSRTRSLAAALVALSILGVASSSLASETIEVNPPKTICALVTSVVLEGGAGYDLATRDWTVTVQIQITTPTIPTVEGVSVDPLPPMIVRAGVVAKRAEVEAAAGKQNLTEAELSVAVRTVIMSKLGELLVKLGGGS